MFGWFKTRKKIDRAYENNQSDTKTLPKPPWKTGRCSHEWTKWKPYSSGIYWQRRTCIHCGFTEEKNIKQ